eukprot:gene16629-5447_t
MVKIIADNYKRKRQEIIDFANELFKTHPETIGTLQMIAKQFHHQYTLKDIKNETMIVLSSRGRGNRNLNFYVHDAHAFSDSLEFRRIEEVKIVPNRHHQLEDQLEQEQNKLIKVYKDENDILHGYRTHEGMAYVAQGFYDMQQLNAEELGVKVTNPFMTRFGIHFKHWINENDYRVTRYYNEDIKASTIECVHWGRPDMPKSDYFDRRSAFNSVSYENHEAYEYFKRYQIPQCCYLYLHKPSYEFIKSVSGFVDIDGGLLQHLVPNTHPYIRKTVAQHCSTRYPTPFIVYFVESNLVKKEDLVFKKIIWGTKLSGLEWTNIEDESNYEHVKEMHKTNRKFIGKTWQDSNNETIYAKD